MAPAVIVKGNTTWCSCGMNREGDAGGGAHAERAAKLAIQGKRGGAEKLARKGRQDRRLWIGLPMERRLGSWSFRVVRNRGHKTNKYTLSCALRCGEGVHASEGGWWEFWGGTLQATTAEVNGEKLCQGGGKLVQRKEQEGGGS